MRISDWSSDVCSDLQFRQIEYQNRTTVGENRRAADAEHAADLRTDRLGDNLAIAEQAVDHHRIAAIAGTDALGQAHENRVRSLRVLTAPDRCIAEKSGPRAHAIIGTALRESRTVSIGRASCRDSACQYV